MIDKAEQVRDKIVREFFWLDAREREFLLVTLDKALSEAYGDGVQQGNLDAHRRLSGRILTLEGEVKGARKLQSDLLRGRNYELRCKDLAADRDNWREKAGRLERQLAEIVPAPNLVGYTVLPTAQVKDLRNAAAENVTLQQRLDVALRISEERDASSAALVRVEADLASERRYSANLRTENNLLRAEIGARSRRPDPIIERTVAILNEAGAKLGALIQEQKDQDVAANWGKAEDAAFLRGRTYCDVCREEATNCVCRNERDRG